MLTSAEVRGKWVLSVEDWAEIRRLHRAERMPIKVIARVVGCSKNTVKSALPPTNRRRIGDSRGAR
jgi:transposase